MIPLAVVPVNSLLSQHWFLWPGTTGSQWSELWLNRPLSNTDPPMRLPMLFYCILLHSIANNRPLTNSLEFHQLASQLRHSWGNLVRCSNRNSIDGKVRLSFHTLQLISIVHALLFWGFFCKCYKIDFLLSKQVCQLVYQLKKVTKIYREIYVAINRNKALIYKDL